MGDDFLAHQYLWGKILDSCKFRIVVYAALNGSGGTDGGTQSAVIAFFTVNNAVIDGLSGADCLTTAAGDVGVVE